MVQYRKICILSVSLFVLILLNSCEHETEVLSEAMELNSSNKILQETAGSLESTDLEVEIADNETISKTSPDGLYTIEMYGTYTGITAGGLYPYEAIQLIRVEDDSVIWSSDYGYYMADFLWSEDSRYVAVNGMARCYSVSFLVDTSNGEIIDLPDYPTISAHYEFLKQYGTDFSYLYLRVSKWNDNNTVTLEFHGESDTEEDISGSYTYQLETEEINYVD